MPSVCLEYARSLYELSKTIEERKMILENFDESLKIFSGEVLKFFSHPEIKKDVKKDIIKKTFPDNLFKNFLLVLIDNDRLDILKQIRDEYDLLLKEELKIVEVIVYSKVLLNAEYLNSLKEKLQKRIKNNINITNIIDESIIGGIKIVYDSKEIDMTVNSEFNSLIKAIKE